MKRFFLIALACVVMFSCNRGGKVEREGEPDIYTLPDEDKQMNDAIARAVQTLDTFKIALQSGNENYYSFSLKKRFDTSTGGEHIWISDIFLKDGDYYGSVGNEPEFTDEVKYGDTVKVELPRISDWMFFNNGKVKGGYTIRVLRDRMSPEEKKQFDEQTGLEFE